MRRSELPAERIRISATDPLNLVGILTPGPRIPAVPSREVVYLDGDPIRVDLGSREVDDEPPIRHARNNP